MKIWRLIILSLITISCSGLYTQVSQKSLSERILGEWSREMIAHDRYGMPLQSPYKDFIIFNKDYTHSSVYADLKGYYRLSNDTLFLFDEDKSNTQSFKIEITGNLLLELLPIASEKNKSGKFNFYGGKWGWW